MPSGIYNRKFKSIIEAGDKYGMLTAIKFSHKNKWNQTHWLFECTCGNEKVILVNSVKNGRTKSCGCLYMKHGMTRTPTCRSWEGMKQRCLNSKTTGYKNYGGRGITVCKRWMKFENFFEDMGERPEGKTLDRKNNNGNYNKKNCRWATPKEQRLNQRIK